MYNIHSVVAWTTALDGGVDPMGQWNLRRNITKGRSSTFSNVFGESSFCGTGHADDIGNVGILDG